MILPPLPLIDGCLLIDNSHGMEPIQTCSRLAEYVMLHGRISAEERTALNFGTGQHIMREFRYKTYQNRPLDQAYFESTASILNEFYSEHEPPADDWRNLNWAMETSRQYDTIYGIEPFSLLKYDEPVICQHCQGKGYSDGVMGADGPDSPVPCIWCRGTGKDEVMVELPFMLHLYDHSSSLGNIKVMYTGRIDLPVSWDGGIWVTDHKTSKQLGAMFWNRMAMSSQQKGYCWAFKTLTGKDVKGWVVNAIRTSEAPEYVKNNGTYKGKKKSMDEWWRETLQRERFYLKENELDEWKNNTIALIERFLWEYSRGYLPMVTESCTKWGKCDYYDVCQLSPMSRGLLLASGQYINNEWSPLRKIK